MFSLRSIWRKVASRLGIWRVVSSFPGFGRGSRCYQVARDMSGRVPATARGRTKNGNYHTSQRRFSRTGCVRISFFFSFLFCIFFFLSLSYVLFIFFLLSVFLLRDCRFLFELDVRPFRSRGRSILEFLLRKFGEVATFFGNMFVN